MAASSNRQTAHPLLEPGVTVIDDMGKDLLIMPENQVARQKLRHRTVLVALRNLHGHVFLYKSAAGSDQQGETWLLAVHGRVLAGESRYDAALRLLGETFGITELELYEAAQFSQPETEPAGNAETTLFLTAKTSALPRMHTQDPLDGMFVDREELRAIIRDYPHMVTSLWSLALPYFFAS
jgi:isopentenyl-diphosphate delta-isomerase